VVGNSPVAIVAADFNGDGKLDLAVANSLDWTSPVSILLQQLGPTAFPHRASAAELPQATLGDHYEDSTHIADNMATAELAWHRFHVEVRPIMLAATLRLLPAAMSHGIGVGLAEAVCYRDSGRPDGQPAAEHPYPANSLCAGRKGDGCAARSGGAFRRLALAHHRQRNFEKDNP
jgi:hypothetical protein